MESLADKISQCLGLSQPIVIQRKIGKSELGTLYQITHPQYGVCALKFLEGRIRKDTKYLRRFLYFIQLVKHNRHPNFTTIRHVQDRNEFFIIRELAPGLSLEQKVKTKVLTVKEATQVIIKIIQGLSVLATNKIIHKNLKPNNIIINTDGGTKITDFSLPPSVPFYLSPEQCQGLSSDIFSDIYALGILYCYCLSGKVPFQQSNPQEVMRSHINTPLPPLQKFCPEVSQNIVAIFNKMTNKQPQSRYASYQELLTDLEKIIAQKVEISSGLVLPQEPETSSHIPLLQVPQSIMPPNTEFARELTVEFDNILEEQPQQPNVTQQRNLPSHQPLVAKVTHPTNLPLSTPPQSQSIVRELTVEMDQIPEDEAQTPNVTQQRRQSPKPTTAKSIHPAKPLTSPLSKSKQAGRGLTIELDRIPTEEALQSPNMTQQKTLPSSSLSSPTKLSETPTTKSDDESSHDLISGASAASSGAIQLPSAIVPESSEQNPDKLPDEVIKILEQITNLEQYLNTNAVIPPRNIYFPKNYQTVIVQYLYEKFHRECWLFKEMDRDHWEIEIDFEQVAILHYLNQFESKVQTALQKLKQHHAMMPQPQPMPTTEPEPEPMQDTILLNDLSSEFSRICTSADELLPQEETLQSQHPTTETEKRVPEDTFYNTPPTSTTFNKPASFSPNQQSSMIPASQELSSSSSLQHTAEHHISATSNVDDQRTVMYSEMPMPQELPTASAPVQQTSALSAPEQPSAFTPGVDDQRTVMYSEMPVPQELPTTATSVSQPVNQPILNQPAAFTPSVETERIVNESPCSPSSSVMSSASAVSQETIVASPEELTVVNEHASASPVTTKEPSSSGVSQETIVASPEELTVVNEPASSASTKETTDFTASTFHGVSSPSLEKQVISGTEDIALDTHLDIEVDFNNRQQKLGWFKFIRENELQQDVHFQLLQNNNEKRTFRIQLNWLLDYSKQQDNIYAIKEFFQSDYNIHELGKGGMGIILKLTTKQNATILALRPENTRARHYFSDVLHTRHGQDGKEIVYAELPANTHLVVKVAFKDYEESLIQESKSLEEVSKDAKPCEWIIGMIQQGHLTAFHTDSSSSLGYYLMLEYASQGTAEHLYPKFPSHHITPTIAFTILYEMTQALLKLKQHKIIHRDIKPQNILFDEHGMAKLSDFGLAITTQEVAPGLTEDRKRMLRLLDNEFAQISRHKEQVEKKLIGLRDKYKQLFIANNPQAAIVAIEIQAETQHLTNLAAQEKQRAEALKDRYRPMSAEENATRGQFAGSLYYAAPEQFETDYVLTPQCDVYQLGAVMYTLCTGRRPVEGETMPEIVSKVVYLPKPSILETVPGTGLWEALSQVIAEMMRNSSTERIPIEQVDERLRQMLSTFKAELQQPLSFPSSETIPNLKDREEYRKQVKFAKKIHARSVEILNKYCFYSSPEDQRKYVFACPKCDHKLHFYRYMNGKTGRCPHCHHPIIVQLPTNANEEEK